MAHIHNQDNVSISNQANTQNIHGDVHFHPSVRSTTPDFKRGIRLGQAPQITDELFIGRGNELEQLQTLLTPQSGHQNVVAVWGMGGMGKTQLSIRHVLSSGSQYSAVYWLNATDESMLKSGLVALALEVSDSTTTSSLINKQEDEVLVKQAREWLSHKDNDRWLIVYDNYDDPKLPGVNSTTGYDIRAYFPFRTHGSILITTRSPRLTFAKQLPLKKLENLDQSLSILATRSGRDVKIDDVAAIRLALRLDGLPLALATAGAYLSQSADSFEDYLDLYNHSWDDLRQDNSGPLDYEQRTLYTTWNLSLQQVQKQNPAAVEMMRLLAYFDNHDVWYELFAAGRSLDDAPQWWTVLLQNRPSFNRAMATLHSYSLVDIAEGSYQVHSCIHDWSLQSLNYELDLACYRIAIHCIARNVLPVTEADHWTRNRRLLPHALRTQVPGLAGMTSNDTIDPEAVSYLAYLFEQNTMYLGAERLYLQSLVRCNQKYGPVSIFALHIVDNLGIVYLKQDKMVEAEQTLLRGLAGKERVLGPDHTSMLNTVVNLGTLYHRQGKLEEAEKMHFRALTGKERVLGPDHTSTLDTIGHLGTLYHSQGKLAEAEQMLLRALTGKERVLGPDHTSTLNTIGDLGMLYYSQGKLEKAERMYLRALYGYEQVLGPEHILTSKAVSNVGVLYRTKGKLVEAEQMLLRGLAGQERVLGPDHASTLYTVGDLGVLYYSQGKLEEAEEMFVRAMSGNDQVLGPNHISTVHAVRRVAALYQEQNRMIDLQDLRARYPAYEEDTFM